MAEGRRLALIVASSEFSDPTLQRLVAPGLDAVGLERVLTDPKIGKFEVKTLINQPAFEVQREIEVFLTDCKKEDIVLLYFSGHGVKDDDGRLYLATSDTRRGYFRSTAIPSIFINETMAASRSRQQVLILDCCHSGAFARGMVAKGGESVDLRERFEGRGRVVLTASNATQYAFQGEEIIGEAQQSVFTRYLVQGLETGEADRNSDGWISVNELYDYAYEHVIEETPQQTPRIWTDLQGDIMIAANPKGTEEMTAEDARLATLYADGLAALTSGQWKQALGTFERIQSVKPGYRDVVTQIARLKPVVVAMEHLDLPTSSDTPVSPTKANSSTSASTFGEMAKKAPPQESSVDRQIVYPKGGTKPSFIKLAILYGAVVLISGVFVLANRLIPSLHGWTNNFLSWPALFVGLGLIILFTGLITGKSIVVVIAATIAGLGGILYYANMTSDWTSWSFTWTLLPGFWGVGNIISGLVFGEQKKTHSGINQVIISTIFFTLLAGFFGGLYLLGSYGLVILFILIGSCFLIPSLLSIYRKGWNGARQRWDSLILGMIFIIMAFLDLANTLGYSKISPFLGLVLVVIILVIRLLLNVFRKNLAT